jgi:hypothetical protein
MGCKGEKTAYAPSFFLVLFYKVRLAYAMLDASFELRASTKHLAEQRDAIPWPTSNMAARVA